MKNPLSVGAFLDWVERQPVDKEYDFEDHTVCPATQYSEALGLECDSSIDMKLFELLHDQVGYKLFNSPRTFGALAERLRNDLTS